VAETTAEPSTDFASAADITNAWRPLNPQEATRAGYWLEVASRRVRNRWPDVDARIATGGDLKPFDVRDVVVALVVEVLGGPAVPNARSFSEQITSGAESRSRSVTLDKGAPNDPNVFALWMVELFEGETPTPTPQGAFPRSGRYDRLFEQEEVY
jgi:hypothetical protein